MQATTARPRITATTDGEGAVSHAGSRLLADVADRTTLAAELGEALAVLRKSRACHDPGRVRVDMAVAVGDDATTISDGRGSGRVVRWGGVGLDVVATARPTRRARARRRNDPSNAVAARGGTPTGGCPAPHDVTNSSMRFEHSSGSTGDEGVGG